jgi:hypothetical protein
MRAIAGREFERKQSQMTGTPRRSKNEPAAPRCLMTPELHRERAAQLRRLGTTKALELAHAHEMLAKMFEKRFNGATICAPSLAPD